MSKGSLAMVALVAGPLLFSCGYSLVGYGGQFPAGVNKVAVPIFGNMTKDTEIARLMTNNFIRELLATGKVEVVPLEKAQAEIRGIVTRYEVERITFDSNRRDLQNRMVVMTDVSLVMKGETEPVFSEKDVSRYQPYPVVEDLALQQKEEDLARKSVSRELSQKIIALMTEGF